MICVGVTPRLSLWSDCTTYREKKILQSSHKIHMSNNKLKNYGMMQQNTYWFLKTVLSEIYG